MLNHLRITNFALLEEIEIDFAGGLSFFTGETGAGKSILIDAICRILGARAAQDDVRAGAPKAVLEAVFDANQFSQTAKQLLLEWQMDSEEEDLIVRREIQASGKSRASINNCSVTLQQLKQLAPYLIDVFGQYEHQTLLDSESQRRLYDESIGIRERVEELSKIAAEIHTLQNEWRSLREREQQRQRNIDMLQYQIREIEEAGISEAEEQELIAKKALLQNSERINVLCESLLQDVLESDENLMGLLERTARNVSELQKYDEGLVSLGTQIAEWQEELNDLVRKIDVLRRSLDFEEGALDRLESRLDLLQRLKKKYGPAIADVLQHLARSKEELCFNVNAEERAEQLVQAVRKTAEAYEQCAAEVTAARQSKREEFERRVEEELKQVAMEKCCFRVALSGESRALDSDSEEELMQSHYPMRGREIVVFEIEPNPGEGFRDLSRIASGGELSRLMLALKVVTQTMDGGHCLIFDEIDAGIGGRVASQIGDRLKRLSRNAQVLCVTHLPQVAAFGDHHFSVVKKSKGDRTITVVDELQGPGRIEELARMLSGSRITETALQHARELRQQVEANAG